MFQPRVLTFQDFVQSGELLRRIELRKREIKRKNELNFKIRFASSPTFDFGDEIATDYELGGLYLQLDNLVKRFSFKTVHRPNYWD